MADMRLRVVPLVLALALAGCTFANGIHLPFSDAACLADAAARVAKVNWLEAETVDLRIRQGEFTPVLIRLKQDGAYVLRIANADDQSRTFRADEFFGAVALERATVGESEQKGGCILAVVIAPGETAEIRFVAARDGRYRFADTPFPFIGGSEPTGAGGGAIAIAESPRPR